MSFIFYYFPPPSTRSISSTLHYALFCPEKKKWRENAVYRLAACPTLSILQILLGCQCLVGYPNNGRPRHPFHEYTNRWISCG